MHFILIGAEGCQEIEGFDWVRQATHEEITAYVTGIGDDAYQKMCVDGNGRPYWLMAISDTAPPEVLDKCRKFKRVMRLYH